MFYRSFIRSFVEFVFLWLYYIVTRGYLDMDIYLHCYIILIQGTVQLRDVNCGS